MCFQEYIAYQCGHRSLSVVRPCPLTTTGHNFPVCAIQPTKQYFAETMCAACERQLHSRWVLIREWEHRWLHERGACGCDVYFPGLLTTPRVIGDSVTSDATTPVASSTFAADDQESYRNTSTPTATGSNAGYTESSQHGVGSHVPAIYSEAVTSSGEHRVTIRLPSLYAAEWLADHRALHAAGKCSCNADFRPALPQIPEEELTPTDRDVILRWNQMVCTTNAAYPPLGIPIMVTAEALRVPLFPNSRGVWLTSFFRRQKLSKSNVMPEISTMRTTTIRGGWPRLKRYSGRLQSAARLQE